MDYKTDCEKKNRIKNSACIPDDLDLPFFTYGFFKPHQIAHSQIERFIIKSKTKEKFVKGYIKHVNGMPVLFLNKKSEYNVLGNKIYFKNRYKKKAYKKIGYSKHMNIYTWREIDVDGTSANALVSSTPKKLNQSEVWKSMQNDMENIIKGGYKYSKIHDYDWRLDPNYDETIAYIHFLLDTEDEYYSWQGQSIKPQMLYASLWTALDRFLTFKYGDTKRGNIIALSKEDYFEKILYDVLSKNRRGYSTVFSAQDLYYHKLDKNDAKESALYYYTLRNNVVHVGKYVSEVNMLYEALTDLLEIFERVLEEVRRE